MLIDTNLLVLLIAGELNASCVGRHRRLKHFREEDLSRLQRLANRYSKHISIPNVLTEASNLLGSGDQELVRGAGGALRIYVEKLDEIYVPSIDLVQRPYFRKFGLADAAVIAAALDRGCHVLTSEWPLQGQLDNLGVFAINIFNLTQPEDLR